MNWNYEIAYTEFQEASEYIKNKLGIVQLDFDLGRQVLLPYQVMILKYLNSKLIQTASEDIKVNIQLILDTYSYGADLICFGPIEDEEEEWKTGTLKLAAEVLGPDGVEAEEYDTDRFVFAWTNALTSLCLRLKLQYAYLFEQEPSGDCCQCGAKGETDRDFESWVSGVYPEDELYDRTNYLRSNSSWQVSKSRYCDCYRKN